MTSEGTPRPAAQGFSPLDAPKEDELYKCVHCGLCLNECPTYLATGQETESPRGRLWLMKGVVEGEIGLTPSVTAHWERCVQCRACEAVCPSGVPFGRLMERTLAQVRRLPGRRRFSLGHWLGYRVVLPRPWLLRLLGRLAWAYQRSGLQWAARRSGALRLLPAGLRAAEGLLPALPTSSFTPTGRVVPAQGQRRGRVALLAGCVMAVAQSPTIRAAIRVLARNGCDVLVPRGQGCCGALHSHAGERAQARELAWRNIQTFLEVGVDAVVTASAGCGAAMKEYPELFADDPRRREAAERVAAMTVDITEFLAKLPLRAPEAALPLRITYQDSCHLAHAQRITRAPRQVLAAIPGLQFVEMHDPARCCGAGGAYNLLQPELSERILSAKMDDVAETQAAVVATANPGCMMQIEKGLRTRKMRVRVCHVVDLLDAAYQREAPR
ncbi:MAG: (Fe-S)-binding protein [Dehalococcoidia bacterium]|nr:(Fe-S)-binding protein [Dehalococcoidia bacterium]